MNQFIFTGSEPFIEYNLKWANKKELLKVIKFLKFLKIEQDKEFPDLKWGYTPDLGSIVVLYNRLDQKWIYYFGGRSKRQGISLKEIKEKLNINFI